jgi:phasin family protein
MTALIHQRNQKGGEQMARKVGESGAPEGAPVEAAPEAVQPATPVMLPGAAAERAARTPSYTAGDAGAEQTAKAGFSRTSEEVKANMEKAMKTAEELVSFSQGNLEAIVKSGQIWAAGMQDLGKQVAASAQAQVDQAMATLKALANVRSLKEAIDLQSSLTRSSVEKAVTETGKLTDASLRLAEQMLAPLTARVTLAAEKFGRAV